MLHLTAAQFRERFVALILGARDLPKKEQDLHVLLISSILRLDANRKYAEAELNDELRKWAGPFGGSFGLDHVTLRRFLVDEGYLERDSAGTSYRRRTTGLRYTFDASLVSIDLQALIHEAKTKREERKRRHQAGPRS